MKSWEFHDYFKYKDCGDWITKTDVYDAGSWFLVRFGGDCHSYIIYIGLFQCKWWLVMIEMSFAFWSSSWVSSKQIGRDILFQVRKGNLMSWYYCFSQRVNSIRGHESLPLVQRTYFRRRSYLDLKQF